MIKNILLYFFTLRYIRPIQVYWRIYLKFKNFFPFPSFINTPIENKHLKLISCIEKHETLKGDEFTFLNISQTFLIPVDWNNPKFSLLWLYNLHYFDYLNQPKIDNKNADKLIDDWITHNRIGEGAGWQPYPISLRIVNWIKYLSRVTSINRDITHVNKSLYLQARFLYNNLEYHLLGNHLFKNGVALLYVGSYFEGDEASRWLRKGLQIINEQVKEQVLSDGGHFERSPTYHVLILEDILDCLNLAQAIVCMPEPDTKDLEKKAVIMLNFLYDILHPDGELPLFNDGALNIAPFPEQIFAYAERLNFTVREYTFPIPLKIEVPFLLIKKPDFGLYTLQNKQGRMLVDAGAIGPDYLPGHAHCDTLSYELSIAGIRCIVNSGTYQYSGEYRNYFRSTKAHNTVRINSEEQHEIWSTFRVARRGYPYAITVNKSATGLSFQASHSGYKRLQGKPVHTRTIKAIDDRWSIKDTITGSGHFYAESFIHLHPDVEIIEQTTALIKCRVYGKNFVLETNPDSRFIIEDGYYSPEFGVKNKNKIIFLEKKGIAPFSIEYTITGFN